MKIATLHLFEAIFSSLFLPFALSFDFAHEAVARGRKLSFYGTKLHASSSATTPDISDLKDSILDAIKPTKRGLTATPEQRVQIEEKVSLLESICPVQAPARDSRVGGHWFVRYTTAPPPSNGQLGPFIGVAEQEIGLESGKYTNTLNIGPNNWLGATLDAEWTEWDGQIIQDGDEKGRQKWMEGAVKVEKQGDEVANVAAASEIAGPMKGIFDSFQNAIAGVSRMKNPESSDREQDFGATSWRVTFGSLTIRLLGVSIFHKQFDKQERIWKMTFIDDDTRVVRAGRTGNKEDNVMFYMTRHLDEQG